MDSSQVAATITDVHRAILTDTSGEVFAVGLAEEATEGLVNVVADLAEPPTVRVLARDSVLKWLRDDFLSASIAANIRSTGALSLRTSEEPFENVLLVTEEAVVSLVVAGDRAAGLVTDDAEFVRSVRERCTSQWTDATEFGLRTPARSHVYETLATEISPEVEADVRIMLEALDSTRGDGLDEVMVSLLAAAKNEELLYDISKWGEDAGVASKATFSRTKMMLEERGLIDTEKVPIDVGRPRLRLVPSDERLSGADAKELVSTAQELLVNTST